MTTHEPWIGSDASGTGTGCRQRWGPGWPPCGAPVTIHVLSESAIDGVVCLQVCEPHAQTAREAGIYTGEHSPSYPGCRCRPTAKKPDTVIGSLPYRPEERLRLTPRPPHDPDLERRTRASLGVPSLAGDGYTHYSTRRAGTSDEALCGAGRHLTADYVLSPNWRIVSCPACRTAEAR